MATPLLTAKLYVPPPHANLVPRPRLTTRLDEGLLQGRKLTLVSAPAGFGKTTLVAEWVCRTAREVAWISLDEDDNDPAQFFSYLIAALRQADGRIGHTLGPALASSPLPPLETLAAALVGDVVAAGAPLVLVLDDYHLISAAAVHHVVTFLLDHQPPTMHVVIATRADPPLPLSRLRARRQVTEVHARDMRFTDEEAALFLHQTMGLRLSAEAVATLEARTEGWAAGLQMAALALQQAPDDTDIFIAGFSGDNRFIMDYLADEVLERQSQAVRDFLRQTAVLERLSAPLCNAVTGRQDSQALLEQLDAANLFLVPLDQRQEWYRYHRLFAEFLRARLDEGTAAELHHKAMRWYEDNGLPAQALHHALALASLGGDASDARRLLRHSDAAARADLAAHRALVEPLTERERDVLRLIAAGYSNQEIARELVIALGTAKRHVNNIYGKLGARSRTQAVAKARELRIL
ncbi:MAG: hypothetical protein JXD18_04255 [Anaerolineae bacterium]|nr:hypothetical protein [Anaerolineae bacterium]